MGDARRVSVEHRIAHRPAIVVCVTNVDLATDLGVDLKRGIPVAVFFAPDGQVIGTTNEGQLEPARYYTSKQILKFVRDIVEKSLIDAPDSVQ